VGAKNSHQKFGGLKMAKSKNKNLYSINPEMMDDMEDKMHKMKMKKKGKKYNEEKDYLK